MPRLGLPLETGVLPPVIVPQVLLPAPVIAIVPASRALGVSRASGAVASESLSVAPA